VTSLEGRETRRVWHDDGIHEFGERVFVPSFALRQALAWWVGAELVRRHPATIRLIEVFPHQYGSALTVWDTSQGEDPSGRALAFLTVGESFHITPLVEPALEGRLNWMDVLLAPNRRFDVVERLEGQLRLTPPAATPSTTAASIGPRVIAAFLQRTALERNRWVVTNGAFEEDDGTGTRHVLFDLMPEVAADRDRHQPGRHPLDLVETRYWFLGPIKDDEAGLPVRAVDTTDGRIWLDGRCVSLMDEFQRHGRNLDRVVSAVMPPAM